MLERRRLSRVLLALAGAMFVVLGIQTVLVGAVDSRLRSDFPVYWLAGQAVWGGKNIYSVAGPHGWEYVYPPPFAIAMVPFGWMPLPWAVTVWFLVSALLTAWAVQMCVTMTKERLPPGTDVLALYVLPGLLLLGWYASAIVRGQASVPLLWLIVAAIFWQSRGRQIAGASCLAGAILMKVFPALLLLYFVWRGRWRFVIATLALLLVGGLALPAVVIGARRNLEYLRAWGTTVALPSLRTDHAESESALNSQLLDFRKRRNESLYAVLRRLTHTRRAREWAAGIALAMGGAIWLTGRRAPPEAELPLLSAVVAWTVLAIPISWSHYFILLLLPLTVLVTAAARKDDRAMRPVALAALIVFGVGSLVAIVFKGKLETYGTLCWATLGVWGALVLAATRRPRLPTDHTVTTTFP